MNILARFRSPRCGVCGRKLRECPRIAWEARRMEAALRRIADRHEIPRPMPEVFTAPVAGVYRCTGVVGSLERGPLPVGRIGDLVIYDRPDHLGKEDGV